MAVAVVMASLLRVSLATSCDIDDHVGQRMIWVPSCEGTGCLADGVNQECAWCVYDLDKCQQIYGHVCRETKAAREAQNMTCTGNAVADAIFELDAAKQAGDIVKDLRAGMTFGQLATTSKGGVQFWDLNSATLTRDGGGSITEVQEYTHAFWLSWRPGAVYRTLFHHSLEFPTTDHVGDHCEFTQSHSGQCPTCVDTLGVQCNRARPPWRPSEYDITANVWTFVVSVGRGDSDTSSTGNTTFYIGADAPPSVVGTSDRVCSGMSYDRIGWPATQGPGSLSQVWGWNRSLSAAEITEVYQISRGRYYGGNTRVVVI